MFRWSVAHMQVDGGTGEGEPAHLHHLHQPIHPPARQDDLRGGIDFAKPWSPSLEQRRACLDFQRPSWNAFVKGLIFICIVLILVQFDKYRIWEEQACLHSSKRCSHVGRIFSRRWMTKWDIHWSCKLEVWVWFVADFHQWCIETYLVQSLIPGIFTDIEPFAIRLENWTCV